MHLQPLYVGRAYYAHEEGNSVSDELFAKGLCLPYGSNLNATDQDRVINIINSIRWRFLTLFGKYLVAETKFPFVIFGKCYQYMKELDVFCRKKIKRDMTVLRRRSTLVLIQHWDLVQIIMMHKLFSWVAVFVWMVLIFILSSQTAGDSNQLSMGITQAAAGTVGKIALGFSFDITVLNSLLRKNAHFFVYLVLGILVVNALRRSG